MPSDFIGFTSCTYRKEIVMTDKRLYRQMTDEVMYCGRHAMTGITWEKLELKET